MSLRNIVLILLAVLVVSCNPGTFETEAPIVSPTETVGPPPTQTTIPTMSVNRISIRTADGKAEFYDTVTGENFIPRGTNYVDFKEVIPGQLWEDYIFGVGTYQPDKVRQAFRRLSDGGYNTVRLFFDHCFSGPACIGNRNGTGLNPIFLDNMVEIMWIAAEEGIYLLFTANGVPADGGYWSRFGQQYEQGDHFGFGEFFENGYYLHAAGVDMQAQYWRDLMSGLAERNAPFDVVLGWQLQNEYWLFKTKPPLSLTNGMVQISNGKSYDMSDPEQKRQMVADGVLFWMETLIPIIKEYDPEALVTVGFFPPDFPNENELMTDWYRDTASLIQSAPVDFWDFHPYPEPKTYVARDMQSVAENFGMIGYQEKPVLMGEFGALRNIFPNMETATRRLQEWVGESCDYGFDGWLIWEYYNRPADDAVWGLENDTLFQALAPVNSPDACTMALLPLSNLALDKQVTASVTLPDEPVENAVDGSGAIWGSGADAPQWIEVNFGEPVTVSKIRLQVAQFPEGETVHVIQAQDAQGQLTELHRFSQFTRADEWLVFEPEVPIEGVQAIRVETLKSPSWVAWSEIEVYGK